MTEEEFLELLDRTNTFYGCSTVFDELHMAKFYVTERIPIYNAIKYEYTFIYNNANEADKNVYKGYYPIDSFVNTMKIFETKERAMMHVLFSDRKNDRKTNR